MRITRVPVNPRVPLFIDFEMIFRKKAEKVFPVQKIVIPLHAITEIEAFYHRHNIVSLTF